MSTHALAAVLLILAGCAAAPHGTELPLDGNGRRIAEARPDNTFSPAEGRAPVGSTVAWVNVGEAKHDVSVFDEAGNELASSLDTEPYYLLHDGDEWTHAFNETGTYTIWCHTHHELGMKMVLHVA